jgi:hypothetical protein
MEKQGHRYSFLYHMVAVGLVLVVLGALIQTVFR